MVRIATAADNEQDARDQLEIIRDAGYITDEDIKRATIVIVEKDNDQ